MRRPAARSGWDAARTAVPGTRSSKSSPLRRPRPPPRIIATASCRAVRPAKLYSDIQTSDAPRIPSGIAEFDRVLGGGIVPGALVLLGGEPGIGKSTLLLQVAAHVARTVGPVLYSSGEESEHQIKLRGERLAVDRAPLYLLAETCLERILEEIERLKPALVIVDSIQTIFSARFQSAPGSIGQVREVATHLLFAAKGQERADRARRPRHERRQPRRPEGARARRRHGAVFRRRAPSRASRGARVQEPVRRGERARRVRDDGRRACAKCRTRRRCSLPSDRSGSPAPRCCAASRARGRYWWKCRRSSASSTFGNARRMASGIDQQRLSLLLAVLEKRAGLHSARRRRLCQRRGRHER